MQAEPVIELRNVTKSLGSTPVLKGISLKIYRGEITAIIGKSGSGKSVLLKHVVGLFEPDSGDVFYNGKARSQMSYAEKRKLKKKFSYVFQDTALFDFFTVFENIALPLKERNVYTESEIENQVAAKLEQMDLHEIEDKYPSQLSGGMKKRVALARALVTDPEIVLFDEPTTGLDPIRKNAVHSMILDYQRRFGFTGVVVTHEIPDIFYISQRIIMIEDGQILVQGSPDTIQKSTDPMVRSFIEGIERPQDSLTGIATPSFGRKRLNEEMSRLQRHRVPFSIVLLTVDNLEEANRIDGYMASQTVFKTFANHINQSTYITDICIRYDLNRVLVILPDTNHQQARQVIKKLTRSMENNALFESMEPGPGFCFSVSAGIAEARSDSRLRTLVAEAEKQQNIFYECSI